MGYAGRMLAKHDLWLNFGLWAVLVGLLYFSVICGLRQEQVSLLLAIPAMAVSFVCSAIVLASFFIGAKQQSFRNRHHAELELNRMEEWLLHAGALIVTVLIGIALLFAVGMVIWWIASLFI
jgi:glucan phosphoethanolaminetransferase (alkaline phosphatase superfamily)